MKKTKRLLILEIHAACYGRGERRKPDADNWPGNLNPWQIRIIFNSRNSSLKTDLYFDRRVHDDTGFPNANGFPPRSPLQENTKAAPRFAQNSRGGCYDGVISFSGRCTSLPGKHLAGKDF